MVHDSIAQRSKEHERNGYWKEPAVWLDVQEAFERYLGQNPNDTNAYCEYVVYALRCERWDKLKELLPKLGPAAERLFGGKAQYDKLMLRADSLAAKTKPAKLTLMIDGPRALARLVNRLDCWVTPQQSDEAFKEYERILDKYPDASPDQRIEVFMREGTLCSQEPILHDRARQVYGRIKKEYPNTFAAAEADRRLAQLGKGGAIRSPSRQ